MTSLPNPPEVPFDTVLDETLENLMITVEKCAVDKTVGMTEGKHVAKQAIHSAFLTLVTTAKPAKLNPKHSESDEEYTGKEWYNEALDLYEQSLRDALTKGDVT